MVQEDQGVDILPAPVNGWQFQLALVVEGQVDPYLIPLLVRMGTGGPVEADLDRSVEV